MRSSFIGTAVALALCLAPALALADTYDLDFTSGGESGQLVLTTSGALSAAGTLVTSISGEVDGFAVSELAVGTYASNDNLIYAGTPVVDLSGLAFTFNGVDQSLFWTGGYIASAKGGPSTAQTLNYDGDAFTYYKNYKRHKGAVNVLGDTGELALCVVSTCGVTGSPGASISLSPAPEPASWALMLVGFAGLGGALRARTRRTVAI